jgi:hypothetical protein
VTVVVDFSAFGGTTLVRCAAGSPSTGLAALAGAGLSVEQVLAVPGFVCRIDGQPGPSAESCATTPPATAAWSYWVAPRGGSWTYSQVGAGYRTPPQGSVEGWAFADGSGQAKPPSVAPPPAPAPARTPMPTATPRPTAEATPLPTPGAITPPPAGAGSVPSTDPTEAADATAEPTATTRPSASQTASAQVPRSQPSASPVELVPVSPTAGARDRGTPLETAAGVGLVAAVVAAAIVVRRRGVGRNG